MDYETSQGLVYVLGSLFIGIVVLLILREIVCWYFKIHQVLDRMDLINKNLVAILEALVEEKANTMKEGVYLLALPGDDFGVPTVVRNIDGGTAIVSIEGIRLLANLPEGYTLIPMVTLTPKRIDAVRLAKYALIVMQDITGDENADAIQDLQDILEEVEDER